MAARPPSSKPAPDTLARKLTYRLNLLHKLVDQESQRRYPQDTGLSLSDGRCLGAIGAFEPLSVNALAQKANLNKAQASRAAQSLVEQGLVSKIASAADGRGVLLSLTPRGRKAWARVMALIDDRNREVFGCLSRDEQHLLGQLFDRLIDHVGPPAAASEEPPKEP